MQKHVPTSKANIIYDLHSEVISDLILWGFQRKITPTIYAGIGSYTQLRTWNIIQLKWHTLNWSSHCHRLWTALCIAN